MCRSSSTLVQATGNPLASRQNCTFPCMVCGVFVPAAKIRKFIDICVSNFWNGSLMRGLLEPDCPIDGSVRCLEFIGYLGVTEIRMGKIEFVILHPLGIRRQTVLFCECLKYALLMQSAKKIIFCHKVHRRRNVRGNVPTSVSPAYLQKKRPASLSESPDSLLAIGSP